jgi:hypothetical protein
MNAEDLSMQAMVLARVPASPKNEMEKMDHLMAEKIIKIIEKAKWGKSHQKLYF